MVRRSTDGSIAWLVTTGDTESIVDREAPSGVVEYIAVAATNEGAVTPPVSALVFLGRPVEEVRGTAITQLRVNPAGGAEVRSGNTVSGTIEYSIPDYNPDDTYVIWVVIGNYIVASIDLDEAAGSTDYSVDIESWHIGSAVRGVATLGVSLMKQPAGEQWYSRLQRLQVNYLAQ